MVNDGDIFKATRHDVIIVISFSRTRLKEIMLFHLSSVCLLFICLRRLTFWQLFS